MVMTEKRLFMGAAIAGGLFAAWLMLRGAKQTAQDVAGGVVGMAEGTITGAVIGIGEGFGVPETSPTQCQRDKAAGRTWDASFSCPAKEFLSYFFS